MFEVLRNVTSEMSKSCCCCSNQAVFFLVQGCESNQTSPDDPTGTFAAAKQAAAKADVTVLAVGLTLEVWDREGVGHETEMVDRVSLELPQVQKDLIAAVRSVAKKVVLVIVSGSAVPFNESAADAVVLAMYGGEEAGNGACEAQAQSVT
jgi:beta-glucosidase